MALEAILRGVINIEDVELRGGQALYGNHEDATSRARSALAADHGGRDSYQRLIYQTVASSGDCGLQDRAAANLRPSYLAGANARIQQVLARPSLEPGSKDPLSWAGSRHLVGSPGSPSYGKQPSSPSKQGYEGGSTQPSSSSSKAASELQRPELLSQAAALHHHLDRMGCHRYRQQPQQQPQQQQPEVQGGHSGGGVPDRYPSAAAVSAAAVAERACHSPGVIHHQQQQQQQQLQQQQQQQQQRCNTPNSAMSGLTTSYSSTGYTTSMSASCCSYSYSTEQSWNSSVGSSSGAHSPEGVPWILPQAANTQVLAAYEFGRQLGVGTFGITRLVRDRSSAVPAACKSICKQRVCANPTLIGDIQREVQIQAHLTGHCHVVGLRGVYEDTRNVHLVLDLCTGGDLHDFITHCPGNRMSEREAAVVCRSMLEALAFCHVRGVIHRDVKPENFLLEAPGSVAGGVKVSDFGVSAFYAPGQLLTELVGTPYYMAPEVIQRAYGPEADVWSAGVVLYLMLCGRLPFMGTTDRQVVTAVLYKEPDFSGPGWQEVSQEARTLVRSMLVKDPRNRATIASLLARPWLRQAPGSGPSAASASSSSAFCASRSSSLRRDSAGAVEGRRPSLPGALVASQQQQQQQRRGSSSSIGSLSPSHTASGRLPSLQLDSLPLLHLARSGSSNSWEAAAAGAVGSSSSSPRGGEAGCGGRSPQAPQRCLSGGSSCSSLGRASELVTPSQQQQER